jgi:cysteine-S-conjugate beta-lyase
MARKGAFGYNAVMNTDFDRIINRQNTNSLKWSYPKGDDILPFWVADMDFSAPPAVINALKNRVDHGIFGYTRTPEELFEVFIDWRERRNGLKISRDQVIHTESVLEAMRIALKAFTSPGDGVIVQTPIYPPLYKMPEKFGRTLIENPLIIQEGEYRMDLTDLRSKLKKGVKILFLCNPHNPVGRAWRSGELSELISECRKYNVLIVSDDIHADLIIKPNSYSTYCYSGESDYNKVIICLSPNKSFNIAGIPSGFVVIPNPQIRTAFLSEREKTGVSLPNLLSITAAKAAYQWGDKWLDEVLDYIAGNYRFLKNTLEKEIKGVNIYPLEGTYLVWVDFSCLGSKAAELNDRLKNEGKIFLSDGAAFGTGGRGFQRINIACPRALLREGVSRIVSTLQGLI